MQGIGKSNKTNFGPVRLPQIIGIEYNYAPPKTGQETKQKNNNIILT